MNTDKAKAQIAYLLGMDKDPSQWTQAQHERIEGYIKAGRDQFENPPPVDPELAKTIFEKARGRMLT